jgi:hypothetical protein
VTETDAGKGIFPVAGLGCAGAGDDRPGDHRHQGVQPFGQARDVGSDMMVSMFGALSGQHPLFYLAVYSPAIAALAASFFLHCSISS